MEQQLEQQLAVIPQDIYRSYIFPQLSMQDLEAFATLSPALKNIVTNYYHWAVQNSVNLSPERKQTFSQIIDGSFQFSSNLHDVEPGFFLIPAVRQTKQKESAIPDMNPISIDDADIIAALFAPLFEDMRKNPNTYLVRPGETLEESQLKIEEKITDTQQRLGTCRAALKSQGFSNIGFESNGTVFVYPPFVDPLTNAQKKTFADTVKLAELMQNTFNPLLFAEKNNHPTLVKTVYDHAMKQTLETPEPFGYKPKGLTIGTSLEYCRNTEGELIKKHHDLKNLTVKFNRVLWAIYTRQPLKIFDKHYTDAMKGLKLDSSSSLSLLETLVDYAGLTGNRDAVNHIVLSDHIHLLTRFLDAIEQERIIPEKKPGRRAALEQARIDVIKMCVDAGLDKNKAFELVEKRQHTALMNILAPEQHDRERKKQMRHTLYQHFANHANKETERKGKALYRELRAVGPMAFFQAHRTEKEVMAIVEVKKPAEKTTQHSGAKTLKTTFGLGVQRNRAAQTEIVTTQFSRQAKVFVNGSRGK